MAARVAVGAVTAALVVSLAGSFVVPVGAGADVEPVAFDDTVSLGMRGSTLHEAEAGATTLPKVQAFYAEYEYVVGYYGVESYVREHRRTGHDRQFGRPVAVFVTDFGDTGVSVTDRGRLVTADGASPAFVPAESTYLVVGSAARTPGGPVAVPFADRADARAFAAAHGGRVHPWDRALGRLNATRSLTRERFRSAVDARSRWADGAVAATRPLRDRPVSVTVGADAPTLRAAVAAAPPNTTVRLPPGDYRVANLTVTKSVTLSGAGPAATHLHGDGEGTVLRLTADRAAVTGLSIDGVGPVGSPARRPNGTVGWSEQIELAYGRGDAAVRLDGTDGALVESVHVDTPASGVVTREAAGAVVREVVVNGTADRSGFMGVVAMYAPVVVEDSRFVGGRDGVYTHRAHGVVVRDSRMRDARYGVHLMYTSGALVRGNAFRNETTGVIVMSRPTGTLVVGNVVTDSRTGLSTVGSASYYAENVLVDNEQGLRLSGTGSLYTHNTVVGNEVGVRGSSLLPTNHVTRNDVVGNARPVSSRFGALQVWTVDGAGNYWGPLPGTDRDDDGYAARPYRPTGPVDSRLHARAGAPTVAVSPAVELTRGLQGAVPGLRATGVVDVAPRTEPVRPEALDRARGNLSRRGAGAEVTA